MIYAVIDEKSRRYYTYLKEIFEAIDNKQTAYNWLITDSEIVARSEETAALNTKASWYGVDGKQLPFPVPDYVFLSGAELSEIVARDDAQWIWGVLSGFDPSIPLEEILRYPLPEADGYKGFWQNQPSLQHPLASIEIVPWDSSLVLFLSKSKELVDRFRTAFPGCEDLSEHNA